MMEHRNNFLRQVKTLRELADAEISRQSYVSLLDTTCLDHEESEIWNQGEQETQHRIRSQRINYQECQCSSLLGQRCVCQDTGIIGDIIKSKSHVSKPDNKHDCVIRSINKINTIRRIHVMEEYEHKCQQTGTDEKDERNCQENGECKNACEPDANNTSNTENFYGNPSSTADVNTEADSLVHRPDERDDTTTGSARAEIMEQDQERGERDDTTGSACAEIKEQDQERGEKLEHCIQRNFQEKDLFDTKNSFDKETPDNNIILAKPATDDVKCSMDHKLAKKDDDIGTIHAGKRNQGTGQNHEYSNTCNYHKNEECRLSDIPDTEAYEENNPSLESNEDEERSSLGHKSDEKDKTVNLKCAWTQTHNQETRQEHECDFQPNCQEDEVCRAVSRVNDNVFNVGTFDFNLGKHSIDLKQKCDDEEKVVCSICVGTQTQNAVTVDGNTRENICSIMTSKDVSCAESTFEDETRSKQDALSGSIKDDSKDSKKQNFDKNLGAIHDEEQNKEKLSSEINFYIGLGNGIHKDNFGPDTSEGDHSVVLTCKMTTRYEGGMGNQETNAYTDLNVHSETNERKPKATLSSISCQTEHNEEKCLSSNEKRYAPNGENAVDGKNDGEKSKSSNSCNQVSKALELDGRGLKHVSALGFKQDDETERQESKGTQTWEKELRISGSVTEGDDSGSSLNERKTLQNGGTNSSEGELGTERNESIRNSCSMPSTVSEQLEESAGLISALKLRTHDDAANKLGCEEFQALQGEDQVSSKAGDSCASNENDDSCLEVDTIIEGLDFESEEQRRTFKDKIKAMNGIFYDELKTIREQHRRLRAQKMTIDYKNSEKGNDGLLSSWFKFGVLKSCGEIATKLYSKLAEDVMLIKDFENMLFSLESQKSKTDAIVEDLKHDFEERMLQDENRQKGCYGFEDSFIKKMKADGGLWYKNSEEEEILLKYDYLPPPFSLDILKSKDLAEEASETTSQLSDIQDGEQKAS